MKKFDVLILGYYGFGNLGDQLLLEAIIDLLKHEGVELSRVAVLSARNQEGALHDEVHYINRWDIKDVCNALKKSKTLLLGGGGLFQDTSSVKSCLYYWGVVRLGKIFGCKVWAVGQSVGPFRTKIALFLTKNALQLCDWISVRDNHSLTSLKRWGIRSVLTPDIVFSLPLRALSPISKGTILFNIRPWKKDDTVGIVRLIMRYATHHNLNLRGIAFSKEDLTCYQDLQKAGELPEGSVTLVESTEDFEKAIVGASGAIGMRLHFVVLSILSRLPVYAISYDPKVAAVAEQWNTRFWPEHSDVEFSIPTNDQKIATTRLTIASVFKQGFSLLMGKTDE